MIASTPTPLAAQILIASARAPDLNDDSYVTLLNLYTRKQPARAIAVLDAAPGVTDEDRAAEAEFTRLLLVGRNETMMDRAGAAIGPGRRLHRGRRAASLGQGRAGRPRPGGGV